MNSYFASQFVSNEVYVFSLQDGRNVLRTACDSKHNDVIRYLLDNGFCL